MATGLRE